MIRLQTINNNGIENGGGRNSAEYEGEEKQGARKRKMEIIDT